ncbi:peptidase S24 [Kocuria flava]|uniref:Peptidase S24 n=1 Tax=Kocuria flava TaxID=446860 RepID=A0A2N4SY54_9MICC|nr:translesion error-prone DNA polymerase V autoproteolytic subunit [Kocuria flava]PLC10908.1 peptidase S24 [Kocuria flava]
MRPPVPLAIDDPVLVNAVLVRVPAGFPSPAQDSFDDGRIDLNEVLIRDVTSTYLFRVTGDSMEGIGIYHGDEVLVDRSLTPKHGSVVIAVLDGDFTIKTLHVYPDRVVLHPETPAYPDVEVPSLSTLHIWGVVVYGIRHINQRKLH